MKLASHTKGFTLFEVIIALVIMTMLAGIIFAITSSSIQAFSTLSSEQLRRREIVSLMEVFRRNFEGLSPKSVLTLDVRKEGGKFLSEIQIENSPTAFSFGRKAWYFGWIVLGLDVDSHGMLQFGIRRMDSDPTVRDREATHWLPLIGEMEIFEWSFYDGQARRWVGQWLNRNTKPSLVRLTYRMHGDQAADDVTFCLPWTKPASGPNPL